jgi:hypothetical protein
MAKPNKKNTEEAVDQIVDAPEVEHITLTSEELLTFDAVHSADPLTALTEVKSAEGVSDILITVISTYIALFNALGGDAPATQHAFENVKNFKSAAVKAPKAKKEPKAKAFNEVAALRKLIAEQGDVKTLLDNPAVSDELKVAITAYTTLADIPGIDQAVLDHTYGQLVNFGKKGGSRVAANRAEDFNVTFEGKNYKTLSGAIYAAGYTKELNDKNQRFCDVAWRAARTLILKAAIGDTVESDGKSYAKIAPSDDSIGTTRTVSVSADVTEEAAA